MKSRIAAGKQVRFDDIFATGKKNICGYSYYKTPRLCNNLVSSTETILCGTRKDTAYAQINLKGWWEGYTLTFIYNS